MSVRIAIIYISIIMCRKSIFIRNVLNALVRNATHWTSHLCSLNFSAIVINFWSVVHLRTLFNSFVPSRWGVLRSFKLSWTSKDTSKRQSRFGPCLTMEDALQRMIPLCSMKSAIHRLHLVMFTIISLLSFTGWRLTQTKHQKAIYPFYPGFLGRRQRMGLRRRPIKHPTKLFQTLSRFV